MPAKKRTKTFYCKKYLFVTFGAFLAAIGLELFLVPNQVIDGGIVGISSTCRSSSSASAAWAGASQSPASSPSRCCRFSPHSSALIHPSPTIPSLQPSLAVSSTASASASSSGSVVSSTAPMSSLSFAYYIISKSIDVAVKGLNESYVVMIVTDEHEAISQALMQQMNRGVTLLHGEGGYTGNAKKILYTTMTRLEVGEMKEIVKDIDENAFITLSVANDIIGGRFRKR